MATPGLVVALPPTANSANTKRKTPGLPPRHIYLIIIGFFKRLCDSVRSLVISCSVIRSGNIETVSSQLSFKRKSATVRSNKRTSVSGSVSDR